MGRYPTLGGVQVQIASAGNISEVAKQQQAYRLMPAALAACSTFVVPTTFTFSSSDRVVGPDTTAAQWMTMLQPCRQYNLLRLKTGVVVPVESS
jgi:hypothetical protein